MPTPGHTYEHLAWLVYEGGADDPVAVLTGGSLLVGSAGRTDLLGPDHVDALTAAQFATVRRLAALPDTVRLLPTHGAGSFCVAAMPSTERTSTLGEERRGNALIAAADLAEFTEELSGELMAYPTYYARMAPINRAGTPVLGGVPALAGLSADDVTARQRAGVTVVDARDRDAFAAAHLPRSVNIELNSGFGSYVGWVLEFGSPLALVLPDPIENSAREAVTQLLRIGWPTPQGYLVGGVAAWKADGRPTRSYPNVDVSALCEAFDAGERPRVLDVRQELEWAWGAVPGSERLFLAEVPARLDQLAGDHVTWIICSNGHRAAIAASLLDGAGTSVRLVGIGGVGELRQRCGPALASTGA